MRIARGGFFVYSITASDRVKDNYATVCRKTYIIFENGCLALLAMLVLRRAKLLASNQSVLALGVAPSGVRAAAPHSAPARMPGVYAQRLCTMQSQQSIHSPLPRERGLGIRHGCRDRTPKGFAGRKAHKAFL